MGPRQLKLKPGQLVLEEPEQFMLVISVFSNGLKSGVELGNEKGSLELQLRNFAN